MMDIHFWSDDTQAQPKSALAGKTGDYYKRRLDALKDRFPEEHDGFVSAGPIKPIKLTEYQKRMLEQLSDPAVTRIVSRFPRNTWSPEDIEYYMFLKSSMNDINTSRSDATPSRSDGDTDAQS